MKYTAILIGVVCLSLILLPTCASQPERVVEPVAEEAPSTEAELAAIKAVIKQYDDMVIAGDAEGWSALFTDDGIAMPPNEAAIMGRDALRAWAQPYCDQFDMDEILTPQETEIAGDWAFVRNEYTWRVTPKAGGETVEEIGKGIMIFKRQSDGSWKIARSIWSSDNPPQREPTT